jgi:hypothetical protein
MKSFDGKLCDVEARHDDAERYDYDFIVAVDFFCCITSLLLFFLFSLMLIYGIT